MTIKYLQFFRKVAFLEGLSFIVLLGVCMPLKYFAATPEPVRIVGSLHGGLFVLYIVVLLLVWRERSWTFSRAAIAALMSFIPFGTIVFDRSLKEEVEGA
ncbi:MAG: DUF3817 domain-containing protein [Opitutales bacterium]|jgi:integral membrane protein|nr:DUF3817 domain-containing protein [Opitutales bacterium]MDG2253712.1 DUF3817 domain-containing protein [Opitutaceae bacterium]MBT5167104.1 DUF3817 domain-containing protein [Opitutales bacterium]MBT5813698.1 DUF3817 domain-containing protein [Opitutales bacterium]MBT6381636.1 DUF3817 domain-containing protein [Opitutales bacterium]